MAYLDAFSKSVKVAYPYIRLGIANGLSGNAILSGLKLAGIGIRRQTFQSLVRAIKLSDTDPTTYLPNDIKAKPIPELIPPNISNQKKRYRWVVEGTVFDREQEVFYRKHLTYESNVLQTQEDVLDNSREFFLGKSEDFNTSLGELRIASVHDSFSPVVLPR
ncbi:MAG: hypothetical protein H8D23_18625 [Candidatus Brocadiales bacterium]|nr:hypothetical protein [Candidatus Brocadiales bacterium]